ncbi:Uncharacterised protein [Vibrio cholerae]|nr:Uncharacterised protein [Vibrio cholerae]CSD00617.1 Uncharacterised protein [Vibrio cholerae]
MSISRPKALVKLASPSASMVISLAFCASPHAFITKASLTETQAIISTPFSLYLSAKTT